MVDWITVLSLIVFGLALIVAEIIFVPGTTLVGIVGFAFIVIGVGLSFSYFGSSMGWMTAGGTAVATGLVFYFSFKANVWGRFSLKSTIDSKVNEGALSAVQLGAEGVTISTLRPVGKAELANQTFEVKTLGNYVETGTKVRVTQIQSNQIIVEPIS